MSRARVVVGMSGGVDSSVAAALLVEQGYEVVGMMARLWAEHWSDASAEVGNRCCSPAAMEDARKVADLLGIPFYLVNLEDTFKRSVVDYFTEGYLEGVTPNPCVKCNQKVKFGALLRYALSVGADYLATGHYARPVHRTGQPSRLYRGVDARKDQSYALCLLNQEQVRRTLMPLGGMTKEEVRARAAELRLPVADKPESQELCFITQGDYRDFLRRQAPRAMEAGPIEDLSGAVVGRHRGLPAYTIGQRKGLGLARPRPVYVVAVDRVRNALLVGEECHLLTDSVVVESFNCINDVGPLPAQVTAKIRYKGTEAPAVLERAAGGRYRVRFEEPQRSVTPGQAVAVYRGEELLGGGIIAGPQAA